MTSPANLPSGRKHHSQTLLPTESSSSTFIAGRARSAFYGQRPRAKALTGREVVEALVQAFPQPAKFWSDKLVGLDQRNFEDFFRKMPH
jgi:hypothetical protein